jgi:hypothetical protein
MVTRVTLVKPVSVNRSTRARRDVNRKWLHGRHRCHLLSLTEQPPETRAGCRP